MHATLARQLAPVPYALMEVQLRCVVLLLSSIGVRLRTSRSTRGASTSTPGTRAAPIRRTPTTCVQCGLFNYSTIHLFVFGPPTAARTQEKYF
jgi:hypothetical protein